MLSQFSREPATFSRHQWEADVLFSWGINLTQEGFRILYFPAIYKKFRREDIFFHHPSLHIASIQAHQH